MKRLDILIFVVVSLGLIGLIAYTADRVTQSLGGRNTPYERLPYGIPTATPFRVPLEALPDYGTTTSHEGVVTNVAARQQFLDAYHKGEPGRWRFVLVAREGTSVLFELRHDTRGPAIRYVFDNRQDGQARRRRVTEFMCRSLVEEVDHFVLLRCEGDGTPSNISLPK